MNAQQNTEINCDAVGCKSGDDVSDIDVAGRASVGGLLSLSENIGLDINYDYIMGIADSHIGSAGLRIMF